MNVGAWSVGNNTFFYSQSPLILFLYNRSRELGKALLTLTLLICAWFSLSWLSPQETPADQWPTCIYPFNNLFLDTARIALHYNANGSAWSFAQVLVAIITAPGIILLYPAAGEQVLLVTGFNVSAAVLLVLAFYKSTIKLPSLLSVLLYN